MDECTYWCDNVWTWKEYLIVLLPVLSVIVASSLSVIFEESFDELLMTVFLGIIFGFALVFAFIIVPIIGLSVIAVSLCILTGALIGKIILKLNKIWRD